MGNRSGATTHRAAYILERGIWKATCRECGWKTGDPQRRQAATLFRLHIQATRGDNGAVDLRDDAIDLRGGAEVNEDFHLAG